MIKIGIPVFPGSNCDRDVEKVLTTLFKVKTEFLWYNKEKISSDYDAIIIPGGFSFGDRLRSGIIAAHSPIMDEVKRLAKEGIPILGICNGFQILVESELLPGALIKNDSLKFICKWSKLIVKNNKTPFTNNFKLNQTFSIPIANGEGRYVADKETISNLQKKNQIVFQYQENDNPSGSFESIAGICNEKGNVVGMMPHPERVFEKLLPKMGLPQDALKIFDSLTNYLGKSLILKTKIRRGH